VTDAALLSRQVDGTLLVVDVGITRRAFLARALDLLKAANSRLLGVTLNRISPSRSDYYAYAYQYYYYYSDDGKRRRGEPSSGPRLPWKRAPKLADKSEMSARESRK